LKKDDYEEHHTVKEIRKKRTEIPCSACGKKTMVNHTLLVHTDEYGSYDEDYYWGPCKHCNVGLRVFIVKSFE
jgi:ssDNA-binding Zn-finger/Zn-ribbon topoisomerase 1